MDSMPLQGIWPTCTLRVFDICMIIWLIGTVLLLFRLGLQELRFKKYMADARVTTDARIRSAMEQIAGKKSDKIRVIVTDLIDIPMVTGLFRPTIYLPQISFSDAELYHVLSHEWTHYVHKDTWTKFLVKILCAIYWWNPFVYLLKHDIDNILETKSDLHLTSKMSEEDSYDYLQTLLTVARGLVVKKNKLSPVGIGLIPRKKTHQLEQRFHFVLERKPPSGLQRLTNVLLSVVMLLVFAGSYTFIVQAYTKPPELEEGLILDITPETAFITHDNGIYSLYVSNCFIGEVVPEDLSLEPFCLLPIIEKE